MLFGGNIGELIVLEPTNSTTDEPDPQFAYPSGHWKALLAFQFFTFCLLSVVFLNLVLGIIVDVRLHSFIDAR